MLSNGTTNIDSITNFRDYVKTAKECGMTAFGLSEHGNIFEWLHKKEEIEKAGMKYIHAVEAYITENLTEKVRDNYHCVLIAKNFEGFKELNSLVSKSFNRAEVKVLDDEVHMYYMPRISFNELINTSDNIIISTACLAGILNKGNDEIRERFLAFLIEHPDRCFLEIQHHNVEDQKKYNQYLYEIHQSTGLRLVTGTDTHALNERHMQGRAIMQKSKNVHFDDEDAWDLTFKTYDDLVSAYKKQKSLPMDVVLEAIENTNVIADMIKPWEMDRSYKYPHLWEDSMATFREKIEQGIKYRGVDQYPNYQEYLDRIEYETDAYVHNGAIDFMLLMEDILSWCRTQDIQVGYGRGSVNGSVIAWLLGITEMDSIKHKLNFERFMNTERVSLSDIDTDFPPSRIDEVKQYIFKKHGLHCSDIITFNTVADKGAIKDVARALEIPLDIAQEIANSVDNEDAYLKSRKQYPKLFEYVDLVKGVIVSVGSHPCGLICSPVTLEDNVGLCTTSTSKYSISQLNMKEIDSLNYVKLDLLKLDTIELINETCKLAGIERLTPDNVDITDIKVWNAIRDDTTQIFQWEGGTGNTYIKKLLSDVNIEKFKAVSPNIDRMTLLSIGNSAIRPAGASYRDDLSNGVVRTTGSNVLDEFLANTFGYLVFQCQIIDFLHLYCGFTMGEADLVRRGFAKKTGTDKYIPIIKDGGYMTEDKKHYIPGFIATMKEKYGIGEQKSEQDIVSFIQVIEDASAYLFSLNHSQPYSYEGYVSGWLRTYYPLEFLTVAMNINSDNEEKTLGLTNYAKKVGINFHSPKFRHSRSGYYCDKKENAIYKGIGSLKYMNEQIANELFEMGSLEFKSFGKVLYYLKENTGLNSRQLNILIEIGFFEEFGDINRLKRLTNVFDVFYGKKSISNEKAREYHLPDKYLQSICSKYSPDRVDEINYKAYIRSLGIVDIEQELQDCIKYKYETDGEEKVKIPNGYSFAKFQKKYQLSEKELMTFATHIVNGSYQNFDLGKLLNYIEHNESIPRATLSEMVKYKIEHMGYIDYINPKADNRYIIVTNLDTKYSPKFTAYCIQNGNTCDMKIHAKKSRKEPAIKFSFTERPVENGDILYMKQCKKSPRLRKDGDAWVEVPGEYVWWLNDYDLVLNLKDIPT